MQWRKASALDAYYEALLGAISTGTAPPAIESFVAALSGGALPQPGDVVAQGVPRRYVSDGVILLLCEIPAETGSFDTLAFYDSQGKPLATCRYPTAATIDSFTAYTYLSFPLK